MNWYNIITASRVITAKLEEDRQLIREVEMNMSGANIHDVRGAMTIPQKYRLSQ